MVERNIGGILDKWEVKQIVPANLIIDNNRWR